VRSLASCAAAQHNVKLVARLLEEVHHLLVPHVDDGVTVDLNNVVTLENARNIAGRARVDHDDARARKVGARVVEQAQAKLLSRRFLHAARAQRRGGGLECIPIDVVDFTPKARLARGNGRCGVEPARRCACQSPRSTVAGCCSGLEVGSLFVVTTKY
jgi:hypothetical protein